MRCLLIDNYDSFTWNLADYLGRVLGELPVVVHNDELEWQEAQIARDYDCIVVSPGPGTVLHERDFRISRLAIAQDQLPVLGVCLGFQGLAHCYGGRIGHAPQPMHGRTSAISHDGDPLFAGIPQGFDAVRYHSLQVAGIKAPLSAIAHSDDGLIMAIRHNQLPKWGVQFHPESILSQYGLRLLANFRDLAHDFHGPRLFPSAPVTASPGAGSVHKKLNVICEQLRSTHGCEKIFADLFAGQEHCFWLDSQAQGNDQARHSFMGAVTAAEVVSYRLDEDDDSHGKGYQLLAEMDRELARVATEATDLEFGFSGGYVGFFSYEMKSLFGAQKAHASVGPDALWFRVRRFLAFDHARQRLWAVALCEHSEQADARTWIGQVQQQLDLLRPQSPVPRAPQQGPLQLQMALSKDQYLDAIRACQAAIAEGESYEICLTNQFGLAVDLDPFALYWQLRKANPGPFGAYIKSGSWAVLSCSPERFLQVLPGDRIQSKPIKGTIARSQDPLQDQRLAGQLAASIKDRAENLMIVDLLRNDLNRVALPGSVRVPSLHAIESFPTVHHMVSTIEAWLRPDKSLLDLIAASFPGGSISGAPKLRSLEIIDALEPRARGVYCGALGYLGYNRVADLNIPIRTASYDGQQLSLGAGGAITYLSDPEQEFQEVVLKAQSLLRTISGFVGSELSAAGQPAGPAQR